MECSLITTSNENPKTLRPSLRFIQTLLNFKKIRRRTMASMVIYVMPVDFNSAAILVLVRKS
jgi:hypothetical protein